MARVLRSGGRMILTDVITPIVLAGEAKEALRAIGLDYVCEAVVGDFRTWMEEAGLGGVETLDCTPLVREVWHQRRTRDPAPEHRRAYAILLDEPETRLGEGLLYVYVRGEKRPGSPCDDQRSPAAV